ncbi:hypothetical protein DKX38_007815 [Salix brachista]|uniref:B box-type domain-containing protein n=1 Tax=Salix brachista TaxID=2182728 RepID=A0A5N5MRT4_9ROSI|nr:hypothetical protein DKX38_007815 [Salix brachista]
MGEHAAYPRWVLHLIETEFYELCENHSDPNKAKLCNFFCMDCTKSPPFCDHCNNSNVHEGHRVIQKRSKRSRQIDDDEVFVSINGCDNQFSYTRRKRRKAMPRKSPLF